MKLLTRSMDFGSTAGAAFFAILLAISGQVAAQEAVEELPRALPQGTQANPAGSAGSDTILVSRRPVAVLTAPSSSASVLYGFPAGRSFRLIGRDAGFAQVQDMNGRATGWIDETSLVPSTRVPVESVPSEPGSAPDNQDTTTASAQPKPKATTSSDQDPVRAHEQRGIFNDVQEGLSGFLGGVFGNH